MKNVRSPALSFVLTACLATPSLAMAQTPPPQAATQAAAAARFDEAIDRSWTPRTTSRFHDGRYGYGWFIDTFGGRIGYYGWGHGGQMIYVFPDLALTVAITSDETQPSGGGGYVRVLHRLVTETILPAAEALKPQGGTG